MTIRTRDDSFFSGVTLGGMPAQIFVPSLSGKNGLAEAWMFAFTANYTPLGGTVSGAVVMMAHPGDETMLWCKGTIFCPNEAVGAFFHQGAQTTHGECVVTAIDEVITSVDGFVKPRERTKRLELRNDSGGCWVFQSRETMLVGAKIMLNDQMVHELDWVAATEELRVK